MNEYLNMFLLRHGKTEGNKENRYIGRRTDEPLDPEGILELKKIREERKSMYSGVGTVYVSPLLRCRETAEILFPGVRQITIEDLAECDFGEFENKNYKELDGDPAYQAWIDSGGMAPFPGGESRERFRLRSIRAFRMILESCLPGKLKRTEGALKEILPCMTEVPDPEEVVPCIKEITYHEKDAFYIAVVTHGGTIMNLMEAYARPHRSFYEWHLKNADQYLVQVSFREGKERMPEML